MHQTVVPNVFNSLSQIAIPIKLKYNAHKVVKLKDFHIFA